MAQCKLCGEYKPSDSFNWCEKCQEKVVNDAVNRSRKAGVMSEVEKWQNPNIRIMVPSADGYDYFACQIVDVGHSEIMLLIQCDAINEIVKSQREVQSPPPAPDACECGHDLIAHDQIPFKDGCFYCSCPKYRPKQKGGE